jgi:uncharacterized membrane protein
MTSLLLAGLFFIAVHIGVSGTMLRDRLVAAIGERGYMIAFSVASLAGIIWLVAGYKAAPYVDLWGQPNGWKLVADILMLPAFMLVIIGLATPNPTSVAQGNLATQAPAGIVCVTRHPFLIGVGLWATLHLIANGDLASLLFFGAILVVCVAGPASIDAKRRRALGATTWDAFARRTSIIPFAAIASGRNTLDAGQIGWWRIGLGVLAYVLFIGGHSHIIGVSPFPIW